MRISAIVAMSENRVIGFKNQLPWHFPADLKHFKELTTGKAIILGRKTYDSIGRALPNRCNIVVTREIDFNAPGCVVVNGIDTALEAANSSEEVFVIGGATLYQQFMPSIQRVYLTVIHHEYEGDTFFPELDEKIWHTKERIDCEADLKNPYSYSFIILDRISF